MLRMVSTGCTELFFSSVSPKITNKYRLSLKSLIAYFVFHNTFLDKAEDVDDILMEYVHHF